MQSELNTNLYGEFFIAELIANQTDTRKAIVAQVGSKAIGLMSLTTEVDYDILAKNYKLETYDNLCKTEFMDAIIMRRNQIAEQRQVKLKKEAEDLARRKMEEELKCNITANRISLQQFCMLHREDIIKRVTSIIEMTDGRKPILSKEKMIEVIEGWLSQFEITQPSDFFLKHPTDNINLFGHDIEKSELFLETLSHFGLHPEYIDKKGQWKNHRKEQEEKLKKSRKKDQMTSNRNARRKKNRRDTKQVDYTPPSHYDGKPLLEAFKNYVDMGAEIRTNIRVKMEEEHKKIHLLFCNENGEKDDNKTQNILSIANKLSIDL